MSLVALAHALASTRAEDPRLTERAYVVLEKQDLGERRRLTDVTAGPFFVTSRDVVLSVLAQ